MNTAITTTEGNGVLSPAESFVREVITDLAQGDTARAVAERIMQAPHTDPLDVFGAVEIGRICDYLARIDQQIAEAKKVDEKMLALRDRLAQRLRVWLREYGLTPRGRVELIRLNDG